MECLGFFAESTSPMKKRELIKARSPVPSLVKIKSLSRITSSSGCLLYNLDTGYLGLFSQERERVSTCIAWPITIEIRTKHAARLVILLPYSLTSANTMVLPPEEWQNAHPQEMFVVLLGSSFVSHSKNDFSSIWQRSCTISFQ